MINELGNKDWFVHFTWSALYPFNTTKNAFIELETFSTSTGSNNFR